MDRKSKGIQIKFIFFTINFCVYLFQSSATTVIHTTNFNSSTFPVLLQNNEHNAWSTFQLLPGGDGYVQIVHTIPSWSDLATFYSRSFLLNGTQSPSYDTRVETHAPVYSINAFADGMLASILLDFNNYVVNLGVQIYGFREVVRWYEIDITLFSTINNTISNIKTNTYNTTSMGLLFNNATDDGVGQHVFFQIFNASAVTQWISPIMIDEANPYYNYSAVAFSAFGNGSVVIIYESYNTSTPTSKNFIQALLDSQGNSLINRVQLFNSTTNSIVDVIAVDGVWVASVLVKDSSGTTEEMRLLVSGGSQFISVSNSSGFKTVKPMYMTNYFNHSVLLVYRVTFLANSTVFWKSRIFNTTSGQFLPEVILVEDGEILGQAVASDGGLYVAIQDTQASEEIVSLGRVAYVAFAANIIPCLLITLVMIYSILLY